MVMKKYLLAVSVISLCALLVISGYAHSGKTDASGGHIDSSTGEYHYHHGYSAHSHYDMDEDGDLDCPYDFDDKTGINSGNSSPSSNRNSNNDNVIIKTEVVTKTVTKEVPFIPSWVYWVIAALCVAIVIMFFIVRTKCNKIKRLHQKAIDDEAQVRAGIGALHNAIAKKYGNDYLYRISNAPDGDYVDTDLLPHSANYSVNPSNDRYTFFLGGSPYNYSSKFHHSSCRYARSAYEINAYTLNRYRRYQSCTICSPAQKLPKTKWVDEYLKHYEFLNKHIALPNPIHRSSTNRNVKPSPKDSTFDDPTILINWRDQ